MTKIKYKGIGIYKDPKTGIQTVQTAAVSENSACKACKKEPRKNGSSRCNTCSVRMKEKIIADTRLSRKIEGQQNKELVV
jgi:hypothetical protein